MTSSDGWKVITRKAAPLCVSSDWLNCLTPPRRQAKLTLLRQQHEFTRRSYGANQRRRWVSAQLWGTAPHELNLGDQMNKSEAESHEQTNPRQPSDL